MADKSTPRSDIPSRRKDAGKRPAGARGAPRGGRGSSTGGRRAARQRAANRRRRWLVLGVPSAVVVVALVVVLLFVTRSPSSNGVVTVSAVNWSTPAGVKVYGRDGPEGIPLEVGAALGSANAGLTGATIDGVQCNSTEQLVYHHHAHLAVFVDGHPRSLPLGVGMVPPAIVTKTGDGPFATGSRTCLYWLHVHAQDGVIHIESPRAGNFVLGQVFGIWHEALSADRLGRYTGKVTATVNGKAYTGDVTQIALTEHAQIVLNVGSPVIKPPPISWADHL